MFWLNNDRIGDEYDPKTFCYGCPTVLLRRCVMHNLISQNQLAYWEINDRELDEPNQMSEYIECLCDLENEPNGERACRSILTG